MRWSINLSRSTHVLLPKSFGGAEIDGTGEVIRVVSGIQMRDANSGPGIAQSALRDGELSVFRVPKPEII
jgi:hypothetical protein